MSDLKRETVNIHGKEYETVASRIARMREDHPEWGVLTKMLRFDSDLVIVHAMIMVQVDSGQYPDNFILGSGHASEVPGDGNINRTSPLENCETSAIGRALSACGYAGTEYASANEMDKVDRGPQHEPQSQQSGRPKGKCPACFVSPGGFHKPNCPEDKS